MTEAIKTSGTQPTSPISAAEDFSKAIEQSMAKQRDEEVRCVRVFDDCYRCNWWVWDRVPSAVFLRTGTIRKSRFLRARKKAEQLVIEDLSR